MQLQTGMDFLVYEVFNLKGHNFSQIIFSFLMHDLNVGPSHLSFFKEKNFIVISMKEYNFVYQGQRSRSHY